jgi:hypothetical protein
MFFILHQMTFFDLYQIQQFFSVPWWRIKPSVIAGQIGAAYLGFDFLEVTEKSFEHCFIFRGLEPNL